MDGQLSIPNGRRQYYSGTQHCGFLGAGRAAALNSQTFYFQTQLFESRNYSDFGFFFLFASIMLDILGLHVTVSTLQRVYQKIQFKGTVIWANMTLG